MITGKKEFVPIQKNNVTSRMARNGNRKEVFIQDHRLVALQMLFGIDSLRVGAMNHSAAAEVFVEFFMVGNVIFMRKKQERDAAHFFDPPNQRPREPGRID